MSNGVIPIDRARTRSDKMPHDPVLERTVIGTILTAGSANTREASDKLAIVSSVIHDASDFHIDRNKIVYDGMLVLDATGVAWDGILLTNFLRDTGKLERIGGPNYIAALINETPVVENLKEHCKVLARYGQRRRMMALGQSIAVEACSDLFSDPNEAMRHLEAGRDPVAVWVESCVKRIEGVAQSKTEERPRRIGEVLRGLVDGAYARAREAEGGHAQSVAGLSTGIPPIDALTGGIRNDGDYLMICGRPGQGKTSLLTGMALNVAESSAPVLASDGSLSSRWRSALIFSLEMPMDKLSARLACTRGRVDFFAIENGTAGPDALARFGRTCEVMQDYSIYIDDSKNLGPATFKMKVRAWLAECEKHNEEPSYIAIDYFQLMQDRATRERKGSREEELNQCAKTVKDFSDELRKSGYRIACAMGAQLNKAGAIKFCDSGNEHAAYRWDIDHDEPKGPRIEPVAARVNVKKARYGPTGLVTLWFHPKYTLFSDSDR